jgi:hypothetical protein
MTQFLPRKITFYRKVSKSIACVVIVCKAVDEMRVTIFFISLGENKINELVVTSNKLTNNFAGLVTSVLGPDMARGPPVGPLSAMPPRIPELRFCKRMHQFSEDGNRDVFYPLHGSVVLINPDVCPE